VLERIARTITSAQPSKVTKEDRLVASLKPLYAHVSKSGDSSTRMSNLWMSSFDLSNGFFHIAIDQYFWAFFAFSFEGRYFQYTVLPFRFVA